MPRAIDLESLAEAQGVPVTRPCLAQPPQHSRQQQVLFV